MRKVKAKVDSLAQQFDALFDGAMGSAQFGAAGSAAAAKAKLLGFMRDQIEVGPPGAFSACTSVQEVLDKLVEDSADDIAGSLALLDLMRDALTKAASDRAIEIGR